MKVTKEPSEIIYMSSRNWRTKKTVPSQKCFSSVFHALVLLEENVEHTFVTKITFAVIMGENINKLLNIWEMVPYGRQ